MTEKTKKTPPGLGETVLYKLDHEDAYAINARRQEATDRSHRFRSPDGVQVHVGSIVDKGEVVAATVVFINEDGTVNLKAHLNGSDDHWVLGTSEGNRVGNFSRIALLETTTE